MTAFEKLVRHFERFPGIGSRQARRFVFHLLSLDRERFEEFAELVRTIRSTVKECASCHRFHALGGPECQVCADLARDRSKLLVVERDTDVDSMEKSGVYDGLYFVLGGTIPLLNTEAVKGIRGTLLKQLVETREDDGLREVILAFSVNPDGDNTSRYVESLLKESVLRGVKLTHLGRGLSTGSELEYADPETIKNSFKNRE